MYDDEAGIAMYCDKCQCAWDNFGCYYPSDTDVDLVVREDCKVTTCSDCENDQEPFH